MEARLCLLEEGPFGDRVPKAHYHGNRGNSPMPTITKAATPLRMPRYWIPKTTWYRKSATRQLRPMLAIPKKDRNTGQGKKHRGRMEWVDPEERTSSVSLAPAGSCLTPPNPREYLYHPI